MGVWRNMVVLVLMMAVATGMWPQRQPGSEPLVSDRAATTCSSEFLLRAVPCRGTRFQHSGAATRRSSTAGGVLLLRRHRWVYKLFTTPSDRQLHDARMRNPREEAL